MEQALQVVHQRHVVIGAAAKAQFRGDVQPRHPRQLGDEAIHAGVQRVHRRHHLHERFAEAREIPVGDLLLGAKAVAPPAGVGRVRRPVRIEVVDPSVGAVVNRQPEDRHVVGVHHAVDEADPHPVRDHPRGPLGHLRKPFGAHARDRPAPRRSAARGSPGGS